MDRDGETSALPAGLAAALREDLAGELSAVAPVSGGMINQAVRVEVGNTRYFVKWKRNAPPAFFEIEARGLALLQAAGAIRVPQVVSWRLAAAEHPAYLILEWIHETPQQPGRAFARRFGQALAALHRVQGETFGLDHDNYIGELPQPNARHARWVDFYREQRLAPQLALAKKRGWLHAGREVLLRGLLERLDTLLAELPSAPALLHGDLWSGNFLVAGAEPVLVDPAVYYGEREVEIAFTELFGGFPAGFLEAYREANPLPPGYERRRALHQLYPLLVHLNLFGETYGPAVDAVCAAYA